MLTIPSPLHVDETVAAPCLIRLCYRKLERDTEYDQQSPEHPTHAAADHICCQQVSPTSAEENSALCDRVRKAFQTSAYPLKNIQCAVDDVVLRLTGVVARYFDLQMATAIVNRLEASRQLDLQVKVLSTCAKE